MKFLGVLVVGAVLAATACIEAPTRSQAGPRDRAAVPSRAGTPAPRPGPHFLAAPAGDVAEVVGAATTTARDEGLRLVVYVGASWCEPCEAFHRAIEAGSLDEELAGVRFLEFDADRDTERLDAAGYSGRYIPRFAIPGDDGRASGRSIEGGIKGDGAVQHIMRRLGPLLSG